MSEKKSLMLMISPSMDGNKKKDRNEHGLIRMSSATRENMNFAQDSVEIWPMSKDISHRIQSIILQVHQNYKDDNKIIAKQINEGLITAEDAIRIGFVTTKTYERVVGNTGTKKNLWVSKDICDIVIGSDPEFLILDNDDNIVSASNILDHEGSIGSDGAMGELRPIPAVVPEEFVENIRQILISAKNMEELNGYTLKASCCETDDKRDYPVGGHIHIGNPAQILSKLDSNNRHVLYGVINRILDELIAIPLTKIDGEVGAKRRTNTTYGKYGYFGGYRTEAGRLEYRTLSGMWLAHPTLTLNVIGTIKAVIDEIYFLIATNKFNKSYWTGNIINSVDQCRRCWTQEFNSWKEIELCKDMKTIASSEIMINMLHTYTKGRISMKYMDKWKLYMKSFSTYSKYEKYIDGLYELLILDEDKININCDIFQTWLEPETKLLKKESKKDE